MAILSKKAYETGGDAKIKFPVGWKSLKCNNTLSGQTDYYDVRTTAHKLLDLE